MPKLLFQHKSPYELLFKHTTDYNLLKVFGCACYLCLRPYQKHKFDFHTQRCVYLGPSASHKGFKCLSSSGRTYISRHVVFDENVFTFKEGFLNKTQQSKWSPTTLHHLPFELNSHKKNPDSVDMMHPTDESAHRPSGENKEVIENGEGLVNEQPQQLEQRESSNDQQSHQVEQRDSVPGV
ncbi:Retrovirus-related pol polyprotein from transposon tnt 1-94 [Abeliophyllum distichum]|uniref:Retrovirus-related pol polyprotein from transposon tnt 1-94 n=1 Tax=Abeliophyllum distichum TaxID=126358 RepID=A0ABD1VZF7_9LAMI